MNKYSKVLAIGSVAIILSSGLSGAASAEEESKTSGRGASQSQVEAGALAESEETPINVINGINAIVDASHNELAGSFSDLAVSEDGGHLIVSLTETDSDNVAIIDTISRSAGIAIVIQGAKRSLKSLYDEQQVVSDHLPEIRAAGIPITVWGPSPQMGLTQIDVEVITPETKSVLERITGLPIHLYVEDPIELYSRDSDFVPMTGGTVTIDKQTGESCTNGVGVYDPLGQQFIYGTDHCYNTNDIVLNKRFSTSGTAIGNQVINQASVHRDTGLVNGPGSGLVWQGGLATTVAIGVGGPTTAVPGLQVYHSGAWQGENGYFDVQNAAHQCFTFSNGDYYCDLIAIRGHAATSIGGSGDSGAPVYTKSGGKVYIAGVVTGGNGEGVTCANYANITSCTRKLWITDFRSGADLWRLKLVLR